jgi:hypothetical protein
VKQRIAVMLGFKVFRNAAITIAAIELLHRIRQGQFALRRAAFKAELHLPFRTRCFGPEHRTAKQGLSAPAGYLHQSRRSDFAICSSEIGRRFRVESDLVPFGPAGGSASTGLLLFPSADVARRPRGH